MEATKKTSTTKTALLVLAALSMLLSGLFIATASRSDASPASACPDGFSLTADAKNCFQAAVVTSADNPNSCDAGLLTPDGSKCYVAARVIPQEGTTDCPKGYSPDDSLGGMCARFESATQRDNACPEGARGLSGACYILVAKGPRGTNSCVAGTLTGGQCVITGAAPVNGAASCPVSANVKLDGNFCYQLISKPNVALVCNADGSGAHNAGVYRLGGGGNCKFIPANAGSAIPAGFACPTNPVGTATHIPTPVNNHMKIGVCTLSGNGTGPCVLPDVEDPNGTSCRTAFPLQAGALTCAAAFGLINGTCVRYESPATAASQCPQGSVEDNNGDCRKPVADAKGAYYCKDANAALNGTSCVFTSGFLATDGAVLYKCDTGARTVIGAGSGRQVICILGDANANLQSGPSCLQGVLSTDNAYCIVPRIDTAPAAAVAAPVPSFTG